MTDRRRFIKESSFAAIGLSLAKYSFRLKPAVCTYLSIAELSELVRQKKVSPVEITQMCLKRIELFNSKLNAFITVTANIAMDEARNAEAEINNGKWRGPLHGIPIAYKDNIDTAGIKTTAASAVYRDRVPTEDAVVVKKLKNAGAVSLGKVNMHEFALGTTSVVSYYGSVHNPWNAAYIAGGSSGGSAVAVAAGLCYASIGTDTGGSSRLPPACCGITGFKATFGLVSIKGIIPVIESVDHACPICRTVEDAAILLNITGDQSSRHSGGQTDYRRSFGLIKNPVIGIINNYRASEEVDLVFKEAISLFHSLGCKTINIALPEVPAGTAIPDTEIGAYHRPLIAKFRDLYDVVTLDDINSLKQADPNEYIKEKNKMEDDRRLISKHLFKDCDVVILPTTTSETPSIEEARTSGPFALDPFNTEPFNYFGLPAISIHCGFSKNGLPLGLQIVGPRWGEAKVLDIANRYEKATNWHLKHPLEV